MTPRVIPFKCQFVGRKHFELGKQQAKGVDYSSWMYVEYDLQSRDQCYKLDQPSNPNSTTNEHKERT